ncbi:ammonium transporter [Prosthecobacter sp. SYSU 5D2]|uniref:ammonium transporter n=1 Tax=Prosthecobacter sp. SYSU 5D2 TaxID=3134134 RepID=UPI0031FEBE25
MIPVFHNWRTFACGLVVTTLLSLGAVLAQETAAPMPAPAAEAAEAATAEAPPGTVEERLSKLENPGGINSGDNAWMLTSSALVIFMSLPGLALFYGGIVQKKNILSVFAQIFAIAGIASLAWWAIGFSLAFSEGNEFIGGTDNAFFKGVDGEPGTLATVSQNIFAMFQLTFAIITPALIIGAVAERMKFAAVLVFVTLWLFAVYFPFAHMVWGGGFLATNIKAIDFAGGTVVHMTSGFSALVLCILLGKRQGYGKEQFAPHSVVLTAVGTGMLWVGWYGFNAGSAGAADGVAGNAFATTTFAAAIGGCAWGFAEWICKGRPSVLGFASGVIGGLVAITPAAGFVTVGSSIIFGLLGGIVPFIAVTYLKRIFGYDDALDTFGVHGVGGMLGAILTGIFADPEVSGLVAELKADGVNLLAEQLKAVGVTIVWSAVATVLIAIICKITVGLRVSPEAERMGLDLAEHGESGYEH